MGYGTSYSPRLRQFGNALLTPVLPAAPAAPTSRTTKRGTIAINYAEDGYDDEDFDDSEGPRRPTGLRSLRREELGSDKSWEQRFTRRFMSRPTIGSGW
jgi:chromatin structure-remodeling complex subunit SFH1